jgi:hypothetical protein
MYPFEPHLTIYTIHLINLSTYDGIVKSCND